MKLPLNPKLEIFRWGPIPGKFFYVAADILDSFFIDTIKKYHGWVWPNTLMLVYKGRMSWLSEFPAMWRDGKRVFEKYILPIKSWKRLRKEWGRNVNKLVRIEETMARIDLRTLSNSELSDLIKRLHSTLIDYWSPTLFPELGNYGAEKLLEQKLLKILGNLQEVNKIMEIITAPEELSFYQLEELELFRTNNIIQHKNKYFWLKNSHNGVQVLPVEYFIKRKKALPPDLDVMLAQSLTNIKKRKKETQKQFKLGKDIMAIADAISRGIVWQDRRKMSTFISLHYRYLLLKEVSRRTGIAEQYLFNVNFYELDQIINGADFTGILKSVKTVLASCVRRTN